MGKRLDQPQMYPQYTYYCPQYLQTKVWLDPRASEGSVVSGAPRGHGKWTLPSPSPPSPLLTAFKLLTVGMELTRQRKKGEGTRSVAFPLKTGYFQWSVLLLFSSRNASQPGKSFAGELGFLEKRFQQTFSGTRIRFRELF